jgi:membrane fusion protein (multidrug efflux system)
LYKSHSITKQQYEQAPAAKLEAERKPSSVAEHNKEQAFQKA